MGIISEQVLLAGLKGRPKIAKALIDTGATDIFITKKMAESIGAVNMCDVISKIKTGGCDIDAKKVELAIKVKDCSFIAEALVLDNLPNDFDVALGVNFFQKNNVLIDFKNDSFTLKKCVKDIRPEKPEPRFCSQYIT